MPTTPRTGNPQPVTSPYVWETTDTHGFVIRVSFTFDSLTRLLLGITSYRDADCQFTKIIVGTGPDGTPDTSNKVITCPSGQTVLSATALGILANLGFGTIDVILTSQMTAA